MTTFVHPNQDPPPAPRTDIVRRQLTANDRRLLQ